MRLALIGCGLIGASAAWAMKKGNAVSTLIAYNRHREAAEEAKRIGFADVVADTIEDAVKDADAVLVAVPVFAMKDVFARIATCLGPQASVSDVGSVRGLAASYAREAFGARIASYCPVHPIAGSEKTGIAAADPTLFIGKNAIVTPLPETAPRVQELWQDLWRVTGAKLMTMSLEEHDAVFANVSHLPHLVAFTLLDAILSMPNGEKSLALSGPGFMDSTRIAAASAELWQGICLANREALLTSLKVYEERLAALRVALEKGDGATLEARFARASKARQGLNKG